jgi:mannose-6-phosphate isomerase-like protein (cupin superfamily)
MTRHIKEQEVEGVRMPPPYAREIKHLAAPWTMGTKNLWMGISQLEASSRSNRHAHPQQEEIFFVLWGEGKIAVGDDEFEVSEGSCVYVPMGEEHQLMNSSSDEVLRVLSVTSPSFTPEDFVDVHTPT